MLGGAAHIHPHIYNEGMSRRLRIDSVSNDRIKALVRLRKRRERQRTGRFLIEGGREMTRAYQAKVRLEQLFLAPALLPPGSARLISALEDDPGVQVFEVSSNAFRKASFREHPDGLLAVARSWKTSLDELTFRGIPLLLVIAGLEKPGNVGALLRTADAAGIDAVFITDNGTDPFNPKVIRASMGSVFNRPVLPVTAAEFIPWVRALGIRLVATAPEAPLSYWDTSLTEATAVILGNEHQGLAANWFEEAAVTVNIPVTGAADSLNVATAGALVVFEALRQRRCRGARDQ